MRRSSRVKKVLPGVGEELSITSQLAAVDDSIQRSEAKVAELGNRLAEIHSAIMQKGQEVGQAQANRQELNAPLQDIGPILDEACAAVDGLTRLHVNEVKGLKNPPHLVRKTIEMVYLLFHAQNLAKRSMPKIPKMDWKDDCCRMLTRRDFIQRILSYPDIEEGQSAVGSDRRTRLATDDQDGNVAEAGTSGSGRQIPSFHPLASYPMILDFLRATYYDDRGSGDRKTKSSEARSLQESTQQAAITCLLPVASPDRTSNLAFGLQGDAVRPRVPPDALYEPRPLSPGSRRARRAQGQGQGRLTMQVGCNTKATVGGVVGVAVRSQQANKDNTALLTLDEVKYSSDSAGRLFHWACSQMRLAALMHEHGSLLGQVAGADETVEQLRREQSDSYFEETQVQEMQEQEVVRSAELQAEREKLLHAETVLVEVAQEETEAKVRAKRKAEADAKEAAANRRMRAQESLRTQRWQREQEDDDGSTDMVEVTSIDPWSEVAVVMQSRLQFSHGDFGISPVMLPRVDAVMRALKGNPDVKVSIEGHSDESEQGSTANGDVARGVAHARAAGVKEYLMRNGVKAAQLRTVVFGSQFAHETRSGGSGGSGGSRSGKGKSEVGSSGSGSSGGSSSSGGGDGGQYNSGGANRRVQFHIIQELKVKGTVEFSPCSSELTAKSMPILKQVATLLMSRAHLRVRVEGHTDNSPMWGGGGNRELSQERAQSVVEYLLSRGAGAAESSSSSSSSSEGGTVSSSGVPGGPPDEQLTPVGYGEICPIVANDSRANKAKNRRVEFHILGRETELEMRLLVGDAHRRDRIAGDENTLAQLTAMASNQPQQQGGELMGADAGAGAGGGKAISLPRALRQSAADVLLAVGATWKVERLIWLAVTKNADNPQCHLSTLHPDVIREVMRWYIMLGGPCGGC
jgi:outer membrane protein OmpA-like peptidoglycan-associated protein